MTPKRHIQLGDELAWLQSKPEAALIEYRKALELDPTLAIAHWRIGQVHFFAPAPRTEDALSAFAEAVRLAPKWSEPHFWLGIGFAGQKRYKQAIAEYRKAIVLSEIPDERLLISLGQCLYDSGQYTQAITAFKDGIQAAHIESAFYYTLLAEAQHACGYAKAACKSWERVLSISSRSGENELAEKARRNLQADHEATAAKYKRL